MSRGQVDSGQGFPCRLSGGRTTGEQQAASPPAPAASRARAPGALTQVTRSVCAEMPRAPGRQRQQEQAEGSGRGAPADSGAPRRLQHSRLASCRQRTSAPSADQRLTLPAASLLLPSGFHQERAAHGDRTDASGRPQPQSKRESRTFLGEHRVLGPPPTQGSPLTVHVPLLLPELSRQVAELGHTARCGT